MADAARARAVSRARRGPRRRGVTRPRTWFASGRPAPHVASPTLAAASRFSSRARRVCHHCGVTLLEARDAPPRSTLPPLPPAPPRDRFRAGALAVLPLLAGVVPFGAVFGISARAAGWGLLETQALSMLLFAGSAQLAVVTLAGGGAAAATIVLAVALLNLRHVLYGMSLARWLPPDEPPPRPLLAALVTDESFAVTARECLEGRASARFLWGANVTMYVAFALATLAGALFGDRLPDPSGLGLDVIFPLMFLALLLTVARNRRDWAVAALAVVVVLALRRFVDGGTALLAATVGAAALGALLEGRRGG